MWLRLRANDWPGLQERIRRRCADDLLWYVNTFVFQYNPQKKKHEVGPFLTWDFQDEAFREIEWCIENGVDLVIEKSREMGASWMCLLVMEHQWHFLRSKKFLCISRNADAVDCDDPDSLFWKIDFVHKHLPRWLMPKGWTPKGRKGMYYGNPENGSTITGQASTGKAGVGGRATAMFVDEFSQIREDYEVLHRTADTTACRIFNFTHTDVSNAAAELSRRVDMRKLRLHWSQHPDKNKGLYQFNNETGQNEIADKQYQFPTDFPFILDGKLRSPWYDKECVRRNSPRAIAMDLDIDPRGAMSQFFDPMTVRVLSQQYAVPPLWEGELQYDRETGKPIQLIKREGGRLRLWVNPVNNHELPAGTFSIGADVSTGSGATPSCAEGLNCKTGEQVLEYADPTIEPPDFAMLCVALCHLFKGENGEGARLAWEMQGPGDKFGKVVVDDLGYRNVYYRIDEQILGSVGDPDRPGWNPTPANKRLALEDVRAAMANHSMLIRSEPVYDEFLSFKYNADGSVDHSGKMRKDDPSGARVNHGDRVTALCLGWKMAKGLVQRRPGKPPREEIKYGSLAWRRQLAEEREREAAEVWV